MTSITERDAAALLDVVAELDRLDDPLPFPPHFLARLARLVDNSMAGYSVLDRRNEREVSYAGWCAGEEVLATSDDEDDAYWRLRHSHPCCAYRERADEWTQPHTVSDFATLREFHRTEIWNEVYRHEGIDYWLDVGLPPRHGCTRVFTFARGSSDFTERDKLVLSLLRPHLERHVADVEARAAAVDALAEVEETGGDAHDIVLATRHGTIEFASPRSRALLTRYFGVQNGTLPDALLHGTVVSQKAEGRLTVRAARTDGLVVLLLAEEDERAAQLTPRQRDVLAGVASGLTDAQIGDRLGIAAATVGKHLEAIYERLDVHTRTAAAAIYRP